VPSTYTTAYLIGALLFVPVWLVLYWRYPAGRREMLVMSGIFVEDLIWYLYTSALWSTYYKFATGVRLERGLALVSGPPLRVRRAGHETG
jgi:hypothetical protein